MSLQRPLQDLHARADAITRLRLLGDNADELTKWQADVELREAKNERERARKEREARAQQASTIGRIGTLASMSASRNTSS